MIVENEWGYIDEIASTYVVIRLWDRRRMVVPLAYMVSREDGSERRHWRERV